MAGTLILPAQKFKYKDISDQFPPTGNPKKKVFFQAELRAVANSSATFGVVAYPSWKEKGVWVIGTKVSGMDTGAVPVSVPFTDPIAFANNEVLLSITVTKKNKKKNVKCAKKNPKKGRWAHFARQVNKLSKDKAQLAEATLLFTSSVSENPHLQYDVSLDMGTSVLTVSTKPSPPASPEA
jgi:hypothetical protein